MIWHVSHGVVTQSQLFGVGILVAVVAVAAISRRRGFSALDALVLLFLCLAGAILGGVLGALVLGGGVVGFVSSGAVLGGAVITWIACAIRRDFWLAVDAVVPGLLLALGLTRLGCMFDGCDFGATADWGISYWAGAPAWSAQVQASELLSTAEASLPTLPFPVIAAGGAFASAIVGMVFPLKRVTAGAVAATLVYLTCRFFAEFARSDASLGMASAFLNVNQWASLLGLGLALAWASRLRSAS